MTTVLEHREAIDLQHAGETRFKSSPEEKGSTGSRSLLLLLHGEKTNDPALRAAITRLRQEGHKVNVRVTFEAGDVDRLIREALSVSSVDTIVAAGGDGTLAEVVDALLQHTGEIKSAETSAGEGKSLPGVDLASGQPPLIQHPSVALLPLGTSNDFAATTGLPNDMYELLLLATRTDRACPIDVGLLNGKVFMNTASIGASADLGKATSSRIKAFLGPVAFLVTGLRQVRSWRPVPALFRFPTIQQASRAVSLESLASQELPRAESVVTQPTGKVAESPTANAPMGLTVNPVAISEGQRAASGMDSALVAAAEAGGDVTELLHVPLFLCNAANNRQIASMVAVAPNALLDDGHLDITYLTGQFSDTVKRVAFDVLTKGAHKAKCATTLLRLPWLEVVSESPLDWSVDGDPCGKATTFRFSVLHRAIRVHLPDDRLLVAGQPDEPAMMDPAKGKKGRRHLFKLPRGRMHAPSVASMFGGVVKFRKKSQQKLMHGGLVSMAKTVIMAALGATAMHFWHMRGDRKAVKVPRVHTAVDAENKKRTGAAVKGASVLI